MQLRAVERSDWPRVLELNRDSVQELSEVDEPRLEYLLALAHRSLVVESRGEIVAFALAMAPRVPYDSDNYRWFDAHMERFLYLDRVAVDSRHRRQGIGSLIYDDMEAFAGGLQRMVCDVNLQPPNDASLAFHIARGYRQIGRLAHPEKLVALMCKDLAGSPAAEPTGAP